ncbi:hypothetical protein [Undibacterium sp. Di24W]|uniref:hypothetical protein n=1 Tax=Undibacterium sp. Di24W TaxID=3413033 RepID=UPI003BF33167
MISNFLATQIMLPLQLTRIFDYQQPGTDAQHMTPTRTGVNEASNLPTGSTLKRIPEERRKQESRRNTDRRLMQQAIFLNTRKTQGRRHSTGRRASDLNHEMPYRPIYFKG